MKILKIKYSNLYYINIYIDFSSLILLPTKPNHFTIKGTRENPPKVNL